MAFRWFLGSVVAFRWWSWIGDKKEKKLVKLSPTISTHRSEQSQTHCHYNQPKPAKPLKPKITNLKISTIFTYPPNHKQAPRNHKPGNDQQTTTKKPKNFNKIYIPIEPQTQIRPRNHNPSPTTTNLRLKEMRTVAVVSIHPPIAIWITATQSLHTDLPPPNPATDSTPPPKREPRNHRFNSTTETIMIWRRHSLSSSCSSKKKGKKKLTNFFSFFFK